MKKKISTCLIAFVMLTITLLTGFSCQNKTLNTSSATNHIQRTVDADMSIFIRNPIYSTYYGDKVYFIDSFDKLLKVYNTKTSTFENNYLSLVLYSDIIDVTSLDNNLFILAKKEETCLILKIDLTSFEIKELSSELINPSYNKIFVEKANVEDSDMFLISFTPTLFKTSAPFVLFVDKNEFSVKYSYTLDFSNESSILNDVKESLFKLLTIQSKSDLTKFYLIYVYGSSIGFSDLSLSTVKSPINPINACTSLYSNLNNQNQGVDIRAVNLITINDESHFLVTYTEPETEKENDISHLYYFTIGTDATNTKFTPKLYTETASNTYIVTNQDYIVYPREQTIAYKKINYNTENNKYSTIETTVKNPVVNIVYNDENDFVYRSSIVETGLLSTPWNSEAIVSIPQDYDIICIGYAEIQGQNTKINDYAFCLFTYENKNYKGYVKLSDTKLKDIVDIENYEFKQTVTVYEGTKLYSAPTKVVGDNITDSVFSSISLEIKSNVKVNIVDTMCNYTANNTKMVKVEINDTIGYIDCKNIIEPSNQNEFIITNACISKDNTAVYRDANKNSQIDDYLSKNKMVRVDGSRDTKSGYTHITYNDEYGNVLEGYIVTDYIETDSWSTLQIIGCVLIAINIGLLILILIFKKNHIGNDGQKYVKSKKANYKETE